MVSISSITTLVQALFLAKLVSAVMLKLSILFVNFIKFQNTAPVLVF